MRLAVVLPSFGSDPARSLRAAAETEAVGLHGAFCYDHLWPMGHPGQPAIAAYPLLGALAGLTHALVLGTLVARVGLEPDDVLGAKLETLAELAPAGFIAGLGTGDRASDDENAAYGIGPTPAADRRAALDRIADRLIGVGIEVWIGAGSPATNALAVLPGRMLNLWSASPEEVASAATIGPVTWGGVLPAGEDEAAALIEAIAGAGATWAVFSWPGSAEKVADAARRAGVSLR